MPADPFGLTGELLEGQYRVEHVAGEGGFSVVYRGSRVAGGEPVAIKCLKLSTLQDAEPLESFTRRFRDEGRLLVRLAAGSADLVKCLASGATQSPATGALVPYMVLEWLEGCSLADDFKARRAERRHGRTLEEVLALFEPAAYALDHAHKQGVVHRDVKPGNLFLVGAGVGTPRIKVLDFGLAKILDESVGITLASTAGDLLLCSPRYAAPEQFDRKLGAVGPWTDVYSLVLVMLEALRNRKVRLGDGVVSNMTEALDRKAVPTPRVLGLSLPSRVDAALARAVSFDVWTRPQTAGELWEELREAMRGVPLSAPPPPAGAFGADTLVVPSPDVFAREKEPESVPGDGTLVMADAPPRPLVASTGTQIMARPRSHSSPTVPATVPPDPRPLAPPPTAQRPSRGPLLLTLVLLVLAALAGGAAFFVWRTGPR